MEEQVVRADVLCAGGGIVGMMAAIRAAELGAKVVVVEKSNTVHSGNGGAGNDHFLCYIPEVHGSDLDAFIQAAIMEAQLAEHFREFSKPRLRKFLTTTYDVMKLWDGWGIPMKYRGGYEFAGHAFPGRTLSHLKYEGKRQKIVLTDQARKRGVNIVNRCMIIDLFSDGRIAGALGIDTRQGNLIVFEAKTVILGTGSVNRLYPSPTPGWFANRTWATSITGDGRVMAYHTGAELADVEMPRLHVGPKYFVRSGQATWIGVYRDPEGKPVGPFVTRPDRQYGDITPEVNKGIFDEYAKAGKGPVYMDGGGMSDEDYEYQLHWFSHEGLDALVNHMKEEGIDHRKKPVEFMTYVRGITGKICVNDDGETSVKGLYAAGDEVGLGISHAAAFGWLAGENAARKAKHTDFAGINNLSEIVGKKKGILGEISRREAGADYKEINFALQQIMFDYAWTMRSEKLLEAGLSHLRRLRHKAFDTAIGRNAHELMRCIEVFNLIDLGELVFITANERKETRARHIRSDYPLTNPMLNKLVVVKQVDGKPVTEWR